MVGQPCSDGAAPLSRPPPESGTSSSGPASVRRLLALPLGACVGLIWAAWIVFSQRGLNAGFTPYDLTLFRFGVPALCTLPWLFRPALFSDWRKVLVLGFTSALAHALLVQKGVQDSSVIHGAVFLPGFVPICTALVAWIWIGARPTWMAAAGFLLILMGVALIGLDGATGLADFNLRVPGDLYFVAGAVMWGILTVGLRVWRMKPMETVALISACSTVLYLPIYLFLLPKAAAAPPLYDFIEQGLTQGFAGILIAIALYSIVVDLAGPGRAATIAATVPIFTLLLAFALIGTLPTVFELLGAIAAACGIWLVVSIGAKGVRA